VPRSIDGTLHGAALLAVVAGAAPTALARPRESAVTLTGALATAGGPLAWNAILRAAHASQFLTDAPLRLLPASWQDTGSGVFALATTIHLDHQLAVVSQQAGQPGAAAAGALHRPHLGARSPPLGPAQQPLMPGVVVATVAWVSTAPVGSQTAAVWVSR
jgi:hypothetical protein